MTFYAFQHFNGLLNRGFVDDNGLKTAFERGILFDIFSVFVKRCCADDLNFAPRKCGFHHVGGALRTLRIARADKRVNFVDNENYVSDTLNFFKKSFYTAFKLPSELRACDKRSQVKQINFFICKFCGNITVRYLLRNTLGYCGFADARFAYKTRIVLCSAVQYLQNAEHFFVSADNIIYLALTRFAGEIFAVRVQKFQFQRFFFRLFLAFLFFFVRNLRRTRVRAFRLRIGIGFDIGHQSVEKLHTRSAARSEILISHL